MLKRMSDLIFIGVIIVFFLSGALYAVLCEKL
jgi:hypothetical protein